MNRNRISKTTIVNIVILLSFSVFFLLKQNFEFIVYTLTIGALIFFIEKTDRFFRYTALAKTGFTIWLFFHLAAGAFYIKGTRIYDTILIDILGEPFNILRFDQVIHAYCYFVITLFVYSIVLHVAKQNPSKAIICIVTILSAMGVSAFNEIIEFSTVVFFDSKGVGGYYNNALDLVFNLIGIIAAVILTAKKRKPNLSTSVKI